MKQIDVVFFSGCPNVDLATDRAREALQTAAIPACVSLVEIKDDGDAISQRFLGSPSVRVDGVDVDPAARQRSDFGMQCRVYPVGGRLEGAPPVEWIVAALMGVALEGAPAPAAGPSCCAPQPSAGPVADLELVAATLAEPLRAVFPIETAPIFVALSRQLALGSPVTRADLVKATGRSPSEVDGALARVPSIEYADGKIVGAALTLNETPHAFEVDGKRLYTWCALDALILPAILGKVCRVVSSCPATGERIVIQVAPDRIDEVTPVNAVMSGVLPTACGNLRQVFCDRVVFFVSRAAGETWTTHHGGGMAFMSVEEAFRLGRSVARQLEWVGPQSRPVHEEHVRTKALERDAASDGCGCTSASASPADEPLLCTLAGQDQAARATEFLEVFAHLTRTEPLPDGFRWWFRVGPGLEARVRDLAHREHECCRFFEFRIDAAGDAIVWEARTQERARPILEELMRLPETLRATSDVESMKRALNAAGLSFASDTAEPSTR